MDLTAFQAKYLAYELTRRCSPGEADRLAGIVAGARVDLNPHQVDAALFAFSSPLSRGALLADEVGLGKTIEAGLVLSQRWAEHRRRLLIIAPANLRKQWHHELADKFFLPSRIIERKSYQESNDTANPFSRTDSIVICSYQFAKAKSADVARTPWDLVVIDEAHRLRNAYKPSHITGNTLRTALAGRHKLLLTATPLQNSLLELYGLIGFIDDHVFGDAEGFKELFITTDNKDAITNLRDRLRPLCHRTLRRQVAAYISFTQRLPIVERFSPDPPEQQLYNVVSEYLRRPRLNSLGSGQRTLITLVLHKLLASSTAAIAGALSSMATRLREHREDASDAVRNDFESLPAMTEEWSSDSPPPANTDASDDSAVEATELEAMATLASSIQDNSKGRALLRALQIAFAKVEELGAPRKAIIFTESRRTQDYLLALLSTTEWRGGIVLFNGTNSDEHSRRIYSEWLTTNKGSDQITGSASADMRSALVDYFKKPSTTIMIATEAGAEGINLQFCSLIINYDLPWNPQRIEQRIGRCHRYGQKHDVVVVNFLNEGNSADQRVYELLDQKFKLFRGLFGASDEVLGALDSGVDFERRIHDIYMRCRTDAEIQSAFDRLQSELGDEISAAMTDARHKLLEHFDDEVREKLRVRDNTARDLLSRIEKQLLDLTAFELGEDARFSNDHGFDLLRSPAPATIATGRYDLVRVGATLHNYRLGHPLSDLLIARAKERRLEPMHLEFRLSSHVGKITVLNQYATGALVVSKFTLEAPELAEDFTLIGAASNDGAPIDQEIAEKLLSLPAFVQGPYRPSAAGPAADRVLDELVRRKKEQIATRNRTFVDSESEKLERWAEDSKLHLERDLKALERQLREARRGSVTSTSIDEKLVFQRRLRELEIARSAKRRELFGAEDAIDAERDRLIASIVGQLTQTPSIQQLFSISWEIT